MSLTQNLGDVVKVTTATGSYSVLSSDQMVMINASGGNAVVTMPLASLRIGKVVTVVRTDTTSNIIRVNGAYGFIYVDQRQQFVSDGTYWWPLIAPDLRDIQYDLTVTGTTWATVRAVGIPFRTKEGAWRLQFSIMGTKTSGSGTSYSMTISGIVSKNISNYYQTFEGSAWDGNCVVTNNYIAPNTAVLICSYQTLTTTGFHIAGNIELESIPTWATDTYTNFVTQKI